jgi:tripartite-type tricarboxylate transporter receptor subunit TctC
MPSHPDPLELVALAKREPNALSFASSGNGGISHLIGEQFKSMAGVHMLHVPYNSRPFRKRTASSGRGS